MIVHRTSSLLLCCLLLAAGAGAATVGQWLVDGPHPAAATLFAGEDPALPVVPDDGFRPAAGPVWRPVQTRRGRLDLGEADAPRTVLAAAYLDLDRYDTVKVTLETAARAILSVDGEDVVTLAAGEDRGEGTITRPRGRYLLLVRAAAVAGQRLRLKVEVEAERAAVATGTDAACLPTRFDDRRLFEDVDGLSLSPDGSRLLVLLSRRDADGHRHRRLELWDPVAGRRLRTLVVGKVSGPGWTPDGRMTWRQDGALQVLDPGTGEVRRLLDGVTGVGRMEWSPDSRVLYYLRSPEAPETPDPQRLTRLRQRLTDWDDRVVLECLDVVTGVRRALTAAGDFQVTGFALSPAGDRLALVRKVPHDERPFFRSEIWLCAADGSGAHRIGSLETGFEIWPADLAWSPDGTRLAFVGPCEEVGDGHADHNWSAADVWVLDVADGSLTDVSAPLDVAPPILSDGHLVWRDDATLVFPADRGRGGVVVTLPLADPAAATFLDLGGTIARFCHDDRGVRAAWLHAATDAPPRVVVADVATGRSDRLDCPRIPPVRVTRAVPVPFTASDGVTIDGWLYEPAGVDGKLPLIVYYYGGAVSTLAGFNFTHQWLAANGYAVYVLNPRGAHSYGRAFADAHVADWGEKAARDVVEGVTRLLAAHPELDPERVGCYGGSFGGFMTMTMITRSDLFAAAVSLYGISDIASYWGAGIWGYTYGDMALGGGYPWSRPDLFRDRSPLYHADRVHTPLLLLHGLADVNVPEQESEQMFTALRVLGRDVELVRFGGEDHGISGTWRNRVLHRTMLLEWFDRWLKDQPEAWEARWRQEQGDETR